MMVGVVNSECEFPSQTDSPEEMHGWIRDIEVKIQEFRGPPKVTPKSLWSLFSREAVIR